MTVNNSGRITEITDDELYEQYLRREMDELMDFYEYRRRMRQEGVLVIEGGGEALHG